MPRQARRPRPNQHSFDSEAQTHRAQELRDLPLFAGQKREAIGAEPEEAGLRSRRRRRCKALESGACFSRGAQILTMNSGPPWSR